MKPLSLVLSALVASSTLGAMTSAHAGNYHVAEQREVKYDDLDLTHAGGASRLYARINRAAHAVCWTPGLLEVTSRPKMKRCAAEALARAVADVGAPLLSDYYLARNPGSSLPLHTAGTDLSRTQARTVVQADRFASNDLGR